MDEIEEDLEQGPKEDLEENKKEELGEGATGADDRLTNCMLRRLQLLAGNGDIETQKCTIFRVPENIRKGKEHLFEPAVVSIGPFHRGKKHLRAMEEKKWPLLQDFLSRCPNANLKTCIAEMRALEKRARGCYNETVDMDSDSFVEMMLLDGSFLLLIFGNSPETYARYEDAGWSATMIIQDLILIENQLPFFILEKMYNFKFGDNFSGEDLKIIVNNVLEYKEGLMPSKILPPPKEIHHLLHLCHHYIVPPSMLNRGSPINAEKTKNHGHLCPSWMSRGPKKVLKTCLNLARVPKKDPSSWSTWVIPCATELQEAGVKIRKKKPPCDLTEITFQSGILEIPNLKISDGIPECFVNFIALEQCKSLEMPQLISTYWFLMDSIINTSNDVTILKRQGIIDNMLSSEEEVANFFNQSGQGIYVDDDHYLAELFKEVNKYCGSKKHRYRAKLMRDYFNSPWAVLSLFAAIFLLLLTSTQTFYAAFAYHHPPHS